MKTCTRCGLEKPATLEYFSVNNQRKSEFRSWCRECRRESAREWRLKNLERDRENTRRYHEENREAVLEGKRQHYRANKEKFKEANKRWRENNKERERENTRRWRKQNPHKKRLYASSRNGVRYTKDGNAYVNFVLNDPCVYCGGEATTIDHIVPISTGGTGDWDNLAPACVSCNASKGARNLLTFLLAKR